MKWLFMEHAPLILRPKAGLGDDQLADEDARQLLRAERYAVNKGRMLRLADLSREALAEVRAETGIAYDERMQGTLAVVSQG